MTKLSLLKPAENTMAYLKMGIFGDTGSGKTWTASLVARDLSKYIKSDKPVAFFDTESGSNFIKPEFDKEGIKLMSVKSKSLIDLTKTIKEAEEYCSVLIIDSISHVWEEFTDAYLKKSRHGFIELWDWKPIKSKWREQFTDVFMNSNLHIIMCGRQSGIYETVEVMKGGQVKKENLRVGDKMKAEAEVGYEPSLLCQMEKVFIEDGGKYVRRCHVIKERFNVIDSKSFDNPKLKDFLPHIDLLNLGGKHEGTHNQGSSEDLFDEPNNTWDERKKKVDIVLEKIKNEFVKSGMDGAAAEAKKLRVAAMEKYFGTNSWAEVESMKLEKLDRHYQELQEKPLINFRETYKQEQTC